MAEPNQRDKEIARLWSILNRALDELKREKQAREAAESRLALFDPTAEATQRADHDA